MDIQLGNALDQQTNELCHLVLAEEHRLRIMCVNSETGLPDDTRCHNIGFAQIGQMDYDGSGGVLHFDTAQGAFRFTFPDVPVEEVQNFVDMLQLELAEDEEIEWAEG